LLLHLKKLNLYLNFIPFNFIVILELNQGMLQGYLKLIVQLMDLIIINFLKIIINNLDRQLFFVLFIEKQGYQQIALFFIAIQDLYFYFLINKQG